MYSIMYGAMSVGIIKASDSNDVEYGQAAAAGV